MVAEVPTCQNTFAALAPPARMTWRPEVVVEAGNLEDPTALALPWASVSGPLTPATRSNWYRPGARVLPPYISRHSDTPYGPSRGIVEGQGEVTLGLGCDRTARVHRTIDCDCRVSGNISNAGKYPDISR